MPSAVAGILDTKGGIRVVVTPRWRMKYHVKEGEQIFIVPGYKVEEPVPWDDIPKMIHKVHLYISATMAPINPCGTCTLCCYISYVQEGDFRKPSNMDCPNCVKGFGCKMYPVRPQVCKDFQCQWLKSQSRNDKMAPELRPDKSGAFLSDDTQNNDPLLIEVHGTPNEDLQEYLDEMVRLGYTIKKIDRYVGEVR